MVQIGDQITNGVRCGPRFQPGAGDVLKISGLAKVPGYLLHTLWYNAVKLSPRQDHLMEHRPVGMRRGKIVYTG